MYGDEEYSSTSNAGSFIRDQPIGADIGGDVLYQTNYNIDDPSRVVRDPFGEVDAATRNCVLNGVIARGGGGSVSALAASIPPIPARVPKSRRQKLRREDTGIGTVSSRIDSDSDSDAETMNGDEMENVGDLVESDGDSNGNDDDDVPNFDLDDSDFMFSGDDRSHLSSSSSQSSSRSTMQSSSRSTSKSNLRPSQNNNNTRRSQQIAPQQRTSQQNASQQNAQYGSFPSQSQPQQPQRRRQKNIRKAQREHMRVFLPMSNESEMPFSIDQQLEGIAEARMRINLYEHIRTTRAATSHSIVDVFHKDGLNELFDIVDLILRSWHMPSDMYCQPEDFIDDILSDEVLASLPESARQAFAERMQHRVKRCYLDFDTRAMTLMLRQFGFTSQDAPRPHVIEEQYNKAKSELNAFAITMEAFSKHPFLTPEERQKVSNATNQLRKCVLSLLSTYQCVAGYYRTIQIHHESVNFEAFTGTDLSVVKRLPPDEDTFPRGHQRVREFVYQEIHRRCLRIYRPDGAQKFRLYIPVATSDGSACTFTYKQWLRVDQFIAKVITLGTTPERYLDMTDTLGTYKSIVDDINNRRDERLPELIKMRHMFSFEDGILDAKAGKFHPYEDCGLIDSSMACANFFKIYYDSNVEREKLATYYRTKKFMDIPTPSLDRYLGAQDLSKDVQKIFFALIGRSFLDVGTNDDFQVIPWLKGAAGTGKSTMLDFLKHTYQAADVAVISTDTEITFGLQSKYDKFLFIAPEVKTNFKLPSSHFQSMVSGEAMEVCKKHQEAEYIIWRVPGWMGGNTIPNWDDQQGSIARRIICFQFNNVPQDIDYTLRDHLEEERALIMRKSVLAYKWLCRAVTASGRGIWDFLPAYFKGTRDAFQQGTNSLVDFMHSGKLRFGPPLVTFIPLKDFQDAYKAHCQQSNLTMQPWREDNYRQPLLAHNCGVVLTTQKNSVRMKPGFILPRHRRMHYPRDEHDTSEAQYDREGRNVNWIYGCDLIERLGANRSSTTNNGVFRAGGNGNGNNNNNNQPPDPRRFIPSDDEDEENVHPDNANNGDNDDRMDDRMDDSDTSNQVLRDMTNTSSNASVNASTARRRNRPLSASQSSSSSTSSTNKRGPNPKWTKPSTKKSPPRKTRSIGLYSDDEIDDDDDGGDDSDNGDDNDVVEILSDDDDATD